MILNKTFTLQISKKVKYLEDLDLDHDKNLRIQPESGRISPKIEPPPHTKFRFAGCFCYFCNSEQT